MQEIRTGQYARYKGQEYKAGYSFEDEKYVLLSDTGDEGFVPNRSGRFVKRVQANELDEVYEIETFGLFQGHKVPLSFVKEGVYHSRTGSRALALDLEYRLLEPGHYERLFEEEELENVWEEKVSKSVI